MEIKSKLIDMVGPEYVADDPESLATYSKDNSLIKTKGAPDMIVRPGNAEEVQEIVKYANETKLPVIPSSSTIHFHGSTVPKMGGIVMDLRRMNKILDINLPDRLARIEPGVTWAQIQDELKKINQRMIMPLMPPASSSVISSLLEREVPTNPRWEYGEPMTSTEVIWGNGMRFRTGSASVPGFPEKADSRGGNPEGPGTNWYRFFQGAEGTMGVLTWAIVKFEYLPDIHKSYFFCFDRLSDAIEPLYRIQRQMIGNECFLLNNHVGALIFGDDSPDNHERLKKQLPPWFIVLTISGSPRLPEEKMAYEKRALDYISGQLPQVKRIDTTLPGAVGLEKRLPELLRNPWPEHRTYWKHQLKGGCQELFFITKMEKVPGFTKTVMEIAGAYGFDVGEMGVYLQPIEQGRAAHMEYQFSYNPSMENEKEKIRALYMEAAEVLFKEGAFFSRPYGLLSPMVFEKARGYTNTITKIKNILDPNHIMCPGNICF